MVIQIVPVLSLSDDIAKCRPAVYPNPNWGINLSACTQIKDVLVVTIGMIGVRMTVVVPKNGAYAVHRDVVRVINCLHDIRVLVNKLHHLSYANDDVSFA